MTTKGYRVKLTVLVPYEFGNLDSQAEAIGTVQRLKNLDGSTDFAAVTVESFSHSSGVPRAQGGD